MQLSSMLYTELGSNLLNNDPCASNQMIGILLNERPRDTSVVQLRDLICHVYDSVNEVSVCFLHFSETKTSTPLYKQHITTSINQ